MTSATGTAALAAASLLPGCASSSSKGGEKSCCDLPLNISFQEGIAPGETLPEKLDFMESLGVVGFEPGGRGLKDRVKEIKDAYTMRKVINQGRDASEGVTAAPEPPRRRLRR